ncbi:MAG: hypothetical protein ABSG43_25565, partial [Solirubrobacteraceae bacterium]
RHHPDRWWCGASRRHHIHRRCGRAVARAEGAAELVGVAEQVVEAGLDRAWRWRVLAFGGAVGRSEPAKALGVLREGF